MSKSRPKRPSADATRNIILQTALQLFMQHGFAGTSMGKLAEKAEINQTLIFHHFGNKKQLWRDVKAKIIADSKTTPINLQPKTLDEFLSEAIMQRTSLYIECPQLKKLIGWQRLESTQNKKGIAGIPSNLISPEKWLEPIKFLQNKNLFNPQLEPELALIWLVASIDGMLIDDRGIFKNNPKNQKKYSEMLIHGLTKAFGT